MLTTQYAFTKGNEQKQPTCAALKNAIVNKDVKSKVAAKKWLYMIVG